MKHSKPKLQNAERQVDDLIVGDLMRINPRFRRSVQIEMDINDVSSTKDYIVTDFVRSCFKRISESCEKGSSQRAWRLTGDYGSGKSAFALAMAKAASGRDQELPRELRGIVRGNKLQPVVVTGDAEPLTKGIGRALIQQIVGLKKQPLPASTEDLLDLIGKARVAVEKSGKLGILLVLDELGKNLEHSTLEPQSSDVYCLQRLAELASRSGDRPLILLGILHQGIASYTAGLDATTRREWDKVAGRFDEIIFSHPLEQTVLLCAEVLGIDVDKLPVHIVKEARESMRWAVSSGMYGSASVDKLVELAPRLFPLHPTVLPPLLNLLRKFAQNERSLFGFFSGYEQRSLQEFAGIRVSQAKFFRLPDLYDYFKANLAHTMTNGRATHWRIVESVVRQAPDANSNEYPVLKSIGILNLIDDDDLLATQDMLRESMAHGEYHKLDEAINLLKARHVLYERGSVRGYCLWPHTSVHLADCFEEARHHLGEPKNPMGMVASQLENQTIVARRHYIETGNLRHFEVQFHPAKDYEKICAEELDSDRVKADGNIHIFLPEDEREFKLTYEQLADKARHPCSRVIVGLTRPPVELLSVAKDLQCWNWVMENVKELSGDEFARHELKAQIRNTKDLLDRRQEKITGLNISQEGNSISWFWQGEPFEMDRNGIGSSLSSLCETIYPECPIITNELINRRVTSPAASRARTILIEAISSHPDKPYLGMDNSKNPPEIAMYLSVLQTGKVHVEGKDGWKINIPSKKDDIGHLRPSLIAIEKLLKSHEGQRISVPRIFEELRKEPIGARDGMLPLLLAIYLAARWHQTAAFENGTYRHRLGGSEFQRLIKEPECFELQHCAIEGVQLEVFQSLSKIFGLAKSDDPEVLDLVRPLVKFIAEVPDYSRNTLKLTKEAKELRKCLLEARDPSKLIFAEIPTAIGVVPNDAKSIAAKLPIFITEIQTSYDRLLDRISSSITDAFETSIPISEFRSELLMRTKAISEKLADVELKSFVLRLGDDKLDYRQWLESLASHLSRKSAVRWDDSDEESFHQRMMGLVKRMLRAEAANSNITRQSNTPNADRSVWFAVTKPNGVESTQLIYWSESEEEQVAKLEKQIYEIIQKNGRAGLSAAARALLTKIQDN